MVKGIMAKNSSRAVIVSLLCIAIAIGTAWFGSSYTGSQVKAAPQSKASVGSAASAGSSNAAGDLAAGDWATYDGEPNGDHYSVLKQINRDNVSKLTVAWTYATGDAGSLETN